MKLIELVNTLTKITDKDPSMMDAELFFATDWWQKSWNMKIDLIKPDYSNGVINFIKKDLPPANINEG